MPKRWAIAGGICPVSPSVERLPVKTRSTPPSFSMALANTRPVASVSEPAMRSSEMRTPLSAPIAIPSRIISPASALPIVKSVTVPPTTSLTATAASMACLSTGLSIDGAPTRTKLLSLAISISEIAGTCFTKTTIFISKPPFFVFLCNLLYSIFNNLSTNNCFYLRNLYVSCPSLPV